MRGKKGKLGYMAIKLDLEKTYDRLEWPLIKFTLTDMGLPERLVQAIMMCMKSTTLNVLWNGEKTETFVPTRGIPQDDVKTRVSNALNIAATEDLGMYLGMPTINGRVTKAIFDFISQKVYKCLSGWQSKNLSLAGKVTLAQSTLSSILSYAMQTAKLPRSLCDDLDKKTRRFI
ncbi:uncharacterized protein LOC141649515 [Silene latifolia]|uniref:uncharacterized protein LOC141649515 n=1 Tax=Silene latifolia TaxID=37657 RepID=UPI003D784448